MNKAALFLLLPALAACDMDFGLGLDLTGLGWGSGGWGPYTASVEGSVMVGPFRAMEDEVTVELFDPARPGTTLTTSVSSEGGYYSFDLGAAPAANVCSYQIRGALPDGTTSAPQPLFDPVPAPCALAPSWYIGSTLSVPAYEPLEEAFTVQGTVLVDGRAATAGEVTVELTLRPRTPSDSVLVARTDANGRYRFETYDAGERFALCSGAWAGARDGSGRSQSLRLEGLPQSVCGSGRSLPEARIGSRKAAEGWIYLSETAPGRYLGAGRAWAELLSMADGSVVGERFPTLDDGTFHVWFPHGMGNPGCDWLLRVTLETGESEVRELFRSGGCTTPTYHYPVASTFVIPYAGRLALVVEDPLADNTGPTDVTSMTLDFDPQTGRYEIVLTADSSSPFAGEFRVNINLYNPTRNSFFDDNVNDFRLSVPTTTLKLTGYHQALRQWTPGDAVHTNNLAGMTNPLGNFFFRSDVTHFPVGFPTNEDLIAFADRTQPAVVVRAGP